MAVLTSEQQQTLRDRLLAERDQITADMRGLNDEVVALGQDENTVGAGVSNHIADNATDVMEQEKDLALISNLRDRLRDTERALERLDEGTYGICERCGKPISPERLEALPSATLCIDCKALEDKQLRRF
jgi:DnaK suppressor protein